MKTFKKNPKNVIFENDQNQIPLVSTVVFKKNFKNFQKKNQKKMLQVYSKDGCKYCTMAKEFLSENKIPFEEIKLIPDSETYASQRQELIDKTNHTTFPWIFVEGDFIGGYNDLVLAFNTTSLHQKMRENGIVIEEPDF